MKKSMRNLLVLTLAAILMLTAAACGKDNAPAMDVKATMDKLLAAAPIEDSLTLGESDMLDYYGISADAMDSFAATLCADGITAKEIVLVKAKDEAAAKEVETKLQNRLNARAAEADGYVPEQYAIIKSCEVKRDGVYVRMIISPEASELVRIYTDALAGK